MRRPLRPLVLGIVGALFLVLTGVAPVRAATPAGLSGPDVASYQHPNGASIDWAAVRNSGRRWAFVKATEGMTYKNPYFAGDWRGTSAAGLYHGAYHYARPNSSSGAAQAHEFANAIGSQQVPGTLPPILDLEETGSLSPAALISWTSDFLTTLQADTGRLPMIYTYPNFWRNAMAGSTAFTRYPLWIASYSTSSPPLLGWPHWTFWQYTSTGTVDGISTPGATDISVFNGTSLDLAALAQAGTWGPARSTYDEGSSSGTAAETAVCPGSRYVPVTPDRFVDSRNGQGGVTGPVSGTVTVTVPSSVPADATSVVLDVSAVDPRGSGYLRVAPAGTAPTSTALNYPAVHGVTGLVVTRFDPQHRIDVSTYGAGTDVTVDLVGYYTSTSGSGGHWVPVDPSRVVDTRSGKGGSGRISGDLTFSLPSSVPGDALGVVLDVTAVDPATDGYIRVAPAGTTASTTALNFQGGGSTTGLALTASSAGQVTVSVAGGTSHLVVDLMGYYEGSATSGSTYVPVTPARFVDTRSGLAAAGPGAGPLAVTLPSSVPQDATAVILDVSLVTPDGRGYIRFAAPGSPATTTALNVLPAQSRTGLVVTGQRDGQLTMATYGMNSQLVIDLVGYESPCTPPSASPSPIASPSASATAFPSPSP